MEMLDATVAGTPVIDLVIPLTVAGIVDLPPAGAVVVVGDGVRKQSELRQEILVEDTLRLRERSVS